MIINKTFRFASLLLTFILAFVASQATVIVQAASAAHGYFRSEEDFSGWPTFGENELWRYIFIAGYDNHIEVNGQSSYGNSSAFITRRKELQVSQQYDPNFELSGPYYNGLALTGFLGFKPEKNRDITWNFRLKIDPNTYGTAGFVVEPQDSFGPDGIYAMPYSIFGVLYSGKGNYNAGLRCYSVVEWFPVLQEPIRGVNPFRWNDYKIRFRYIDDATVQATMFVNDRRVCQQEIANWGETEIQLWLDNYKLTLPDPEDPYNIALDYYNEQTPQNIWVDDISVRTR